MGKGSAEFFGMDLGLSGMSSDPSLPANDPPRFFAVSETGGHAETRSGPPPLVGSPLLYGRAGAPSLTGEEITPNNPSHIDGLASPPPFRSDIEPSPLLPSDVADWESPSRLGTSATSAAGEEAIGRESMSSWERVRRFVVVAIPAFLAWCREDGYWYLTSMAVHAIGLMSLAMISLAIPRAFLESSRDKAPAFEAPEMDRARMPEIERFQVGDAPLEPTELNARTLEQFEPLPLGSQTEKYYDDSAIFEEAGGGIVSDLKLPNLGGLGGFSVRNLPGPAGKGGVGIGVGFGNKPGSGGEGEGFGSRGKGHRKALLGSGGGTAASERAVAAALNWLHRHQTAQGKWSLDFRHQCKGGACSGPGFVQSDSAATALALLPFLAAGQTHKSKGIYRETISKGVAWLVKQQRPDGDLSGKAPQPMYSHGLATLVLCEAYGMTGDDHIGSAARRAVAYIERAQNESTGGWRYEPGDTGDTSVFGWQIMALKSAQLAGMPVNSLVFENAKKWLHSVAKGEHLGLYSYQPYREVTPTMTAVGMLSRQYLGIDPKDPSILEGKRCLLENLPSAKVGRNSYYWYYATLTMHNFADSDWDTWNRKMRRVLIESQEKEGCATGSWDPDKPTADAWGPQGGRLMVTSLNTLTLEVYYRYLPLFKTDSLVPGAAGKMGFAKPIDDE